MFLCMQLCMYIYVTCCCPFGQVTLVNEILNLNKFVNKEVSFFFFSPRQSFTNMLWCERWDRFWHKAKALTWIQGKVNNDSIFRTHLKTFFQCKRDLVCRVPLLVAFTSLFMLPPQRCHLIPKMSNIFNTNNPP